MNDRARQSPHVTRALLFVDLDDFKRVNDQHGHKAGDALLQTVAQRVRAILRAGDTVARWGGDEFVILLELIDPEQLERTIERVRAAVEAPVTFGPNTLRVGASIGIAHYTGDNTRLEDLLRSADHRMYADKTRRKTP